VRGFTQALAQELGPHGITVNAVCPGLTDTARINDMASVLAPEGVPPDDYRGEMIRSAIDRTPLGRLGEAADVANTVAFLASSEAEFLTGLSLSVAGGSEMD
jgi:meso-butanediol dehydrogenase/(S,S)-butanediol dehydrogenase/diacetyl reductase